MSGREVKDSRGWVLGEIQTRGDGSLVALDHRGLTVGTCRSENGRIRTYLPNGFTYGEDNQLVALIREAAAAEEASKNKQSEGANAASGSNLAAAVAAGAAVYALSGSKFGKALITAIALFLFVVVSLFFDRLTPNSTQQREQDRAEVAQPSDTTRTPAQSDEDRLARQAAHDEAVKARQVRQEEQFAEMSRKEAEKQAQFKKDSDEKMAAAQKRMADWQAHPTPYVSPYYNRNQTQQ